MIGVWDGHAETYLYVTTAVALSFGLPIFAVPLGGQPRLAASRGPRPHPLLRARLRLVHPGVRGADAPRRNHRRSPAGDLQFMLGVSGLMVVVHVWGALQRVQPVSETYEIAVFGAPFVATLLFYPS